MHFNMRLFERFAMQVEQASQQLPQADRGVDVDAVSRSLNLTVEDGREVATMLEESGWAKFTVTNAAARLTLTINGYREIEKLKRPRWRRWIDNHGPGIVVSFITTWLALLIAWAFKRLTE